MTEPVYGKDLALYKLERARDEIDTENGVPVTVNVMK